MQSHFVGLLLSLDTRMQAVFALQVTQNLHRAPGFEIVRQLMSVLIDAQRYDMKMLSVDILMFENNIRQCHSFAPPGIKIKRLFSV